MQLQGKTPQLPSSQMTTAPVTFLGRNSETAAAVPFILLLLETLVIPADTFIGGPVCSQ